MALPAIVFLISCCIFAKNRRKAGKFEKTHKCMVADGKTQTVEISMK